MNFLLKIPRRHDGLTVLQLRILQTVSRVGGISIADLAEILMISFGEAWENVRVLADGHGRKRSSFGLGLISVTQNLGDRRKRSLYLTEEGAIFVKTIASNCNKEV